MSHFDSKLASLRHLAVTPREAALPRMRQWLEIGLLYALRGIGPGYYLQARWWRREIPFADKWNHVNRREYRRFVDRVNPAEYRKASQHKLVEKAVLSLTSVPTPTFIAWVHRRRGRDRDGRAVTDAGQLVDVLTPYVGRRVVFKPVEGHGGHGVTAYDVRARNGSLELVHALSGDALGVTYWWNAHGGDAEGVVVETYVEQHPVLAALNPSSVNTLRVWVYADNDGRPVVPGAYLRIGRAGSLVDNVAGGGLCCPLDIARGTIREAMVVTDGCQVHDRHPDSGAVLAGLEIPFWRACVDLAGRALLAFPKLRFAGVDIAVTPTGPCMIELNVVPDYIGCARMDLPFARIVRQLT